MYEINQILDAEGRPILKRKFRLMSSDFFELMKLLPGGFNVKAQFRAGPIDARRDDCFMLREIVLKHKAPSEVNVRKVA